jgi:hypothetical protein
MSTLYGEAIPKWGSKWSNYFANMIKMSKYNFESQYVRR